MSKASSYKSGTPAYDGGFVAAFQSGRLTNAASAVPGIAFVCPFAATIVDYHVNIDTQFTHANAALNAGILSDSDSNLDGYDLTSSFTGYRNMIGRAEWVSKALALGAPVLTAELEASDTTGKLTATMVISPA